MSCTNCQSTNYSSFDFLTPSSVVAPCSFTLDSQCINYSGSPLTCIGASSNTCLQDILQKIDTQVCQAVGNYSQYNFHCLASSYTITNESQFVSAITDYVCNLNTVYATFVNTTFPAYQTTVSSNFTSITHPGLTSPNSNIIYNTSSTLPTVITAIATATGTLYDYHATISSANWNTCFSVTAPTTLVGAFNTLISQICSIKSSAATLPVFDNTATCLASPTTTDTLVSTIGKIITRLCVTPIYTPSTYSSTCLSVSSSTTLDQLNQLVLTQIDTLTKNILNQFSSDFTVTNVDSGNLCLGKHIALATSSSQDKYVAATPSDSSPGTLQQKLTAGTSITLDYSTTPGQVIINSSGISTVAHNNTSSVTLSGSGTSGSNLNAVVNISASAGNTLTLNSDGLYATSATPSVLNFVPTSTVNPTEIGNNVTMDVKIDASQPGNILTYSSNGLYCPAPSITPTTVLATPTATLNLVSTPTSGNTYTITGAPILSPTATNQILKAKSDGLAVQVSSTVGNAITINSDGIYVTAGAAQVNSDWNAVSGVAQILNKPTILTSTGTTGYHAKFTSSTNIGNGLIYDTGSGIAINSTTANSMLDVTGTARAWITQTWSSGTSYVSSFHNTATYTGTLTTSNSSYSAQDTVHNAVFNGNTTVASSTPFGTLLGATVTSFSTTGTVTASSPVSCLVAQTQDNGTINGTVTSSAGVEVRGIVLVPSATATVTRTNHYQVLIQDTNQFSNGGNITNKFAIYQVGTSDVSRFFGPVQNASSSVQFTSDIRVKENITPFTRGLQELKQINLHSFNYIYNKGVMVPGVIAQELETIIPEAVKQGNFDLPDGSQSFTDFRMVDQTVLFYTMLQAIKDLSLEVDALKAKLPS